MAIKNVRAVWSTKNPKAGDKVSVQIYWDGTSSYNGEKATSCYVRGVGSFDVFKSFNGSVTSNYASAELTIPLSWKGDIQGYWNVVFVSNTNMVTDTEYSANDILKVIPAELDFKVTLTPANPTLKPGEKITISPIISGVVPPYTATWKWTYALMPMPQYDNKDLIADYQGVGYEFALCDVTITKDGFPPKTVRGDTKVTGVTGTLEDKIAVMISGIPPDVEVKSNLAASVIIGGAPEGATINYTWLIDGVKVSEDKNLDVLMTKVGIAKVQVIASVRASNYSGVTIESPIIDVPVVKIKDWVPKVIIESDKKRLTWGKNAIMGDIRLRLEYPDGTDVDRSQLKDRIYSVDGVPLGYYMETGGADGKSYTGIATYYWKADSIGEHEAKFVFPKLTHPDYADLLNFEYIEKFNVAVMDEIHVTVPIWYFNGKRVTHSWRDPIQIKGVPGEEVKFTISVSTVDPDAPEYEKRYWPAGFKESVDASWAGGKYQLFNNRGELELESDTGEFTYVLPVGKTLLEGEVRYTKVDPTLFGPGSGILKGPVTIEIAENPFVPMPKMDLIQTPSPAVIGSPIVISKQWTDFPAGADQSESYWFLNTEASGNGDEYSLNALPRGSVRNNTFVKAAGFNPAFASVDIDLNVTYKVWPTINLNLMPARTTVPWGEFLVAGFDVVGEEIMDDLQKLVENKPVWHLDGEEIQTLAGDGSLSIRATHPGQHVIKASVLLTHPDYEGGSLIVEKSFNMTTQPREMTTTLELIPVNSKLEKGNSLKYVATLSGAPVDAVTTYKWTIDGEVQPSTQNFFDYFGTDLGMHSIEVEATTTAQDATTDIKAIQTMVEVIERADPADGECPIIYVHPLPWRASAYIWCGWWVMDEIEKLTWAGKDWKTVTADDSKYYCHLAVLAKMLTDYPEVDVQESRNGRIIHRSALEAGIIY